MAITREDILHIADLARLELDEDEIMSMQNDLSSILEYMAMLDDLDLEGVEPTFNILGQSQPLRDDEPGESLEPDRALENAPKSDGTFFVVPRVV